MILYGWIPHLDPSLETAFPNISERLIPACDVSCDETGTPGQMHLSFEIPPEYRYGIDTISCTASFGRRTFQIEVCVEASGLISLQMENVETGMRDGVRNAMRTIYYEFKRRLHTNTHHSPDEQENMSVGMINDVLTLSHEDNGRESAFMEISAMLFKTIRSNNVYLAKNTFKDMANLDIPAANDVDHLVHDNYRVGSGYVAYARNFVSLFMGEAEERHIRSLESYQNSLDTLYSSHCNSYSSRMSDELLETTALMKEQSDSTSRTARNSLICTVVMLVISALTLVATVLR